MQALSRSGSLGGGVPRSGSLSTGKGKALTDALFQRTLSDIIKGMRSRAADLEPYVAQCIAEIRQEAAHPEPSTKAVAVQKVRRSKSSKPSTPRSGEAAPGRPALAPNPWQAPVSPHGCAQFSAAAADSAAVLRPAWHPPRLLFVLLALGWRRAALRSRRRTRPTAAHIDICCPLAQAAYLHTMGYDQSELSFRVVEVLSLPRFSHKRVGAVAACSIFHSGTEVMLLITNLLKKELVSSNGLETSLALDVLARVATPDLARDLTPDVLALLSAARAATRKKACMVLYRFFRQYPESVRPAFKRLAERLEDGDEGVVGAAVSVIAELALHDPKAYLPLAPLLYRLLSEVKNAWTTIKIVKLFGLLCPHEPRLGKKLADVLASIIQTTPAVSLQFECIKTATVGVQRNTQLIQLCVHTLSERFVSSTDANLKYLGLTALSNLLGSHPEAVAAQSDTIFACLDDVDPTIQRRALTLCCGMARRATMTDTLERLAHHAETAAAGFAADVVGAALELGARDKHALLDDHAHYARTLARLARSSAPHAAQCSQLAAQMVDVAVRFAEARPAAVDAAAAIVGDAQLLQEVCAEGGTAGRASVLRAAAWIVGEYAPAALQLAVDAGGSPVQVAAATLEKLLQPLAGKLPGDVQGAYAFATLKVLLAARVAAEKATIGAGDATESVDMLGAFVGAHARPLWESARDPETQDRCAMLSAALRLVGARATAALAALIEDEMNPVREGAQRKVRLPAGLDLDTPLCEASAPPAPLSDHRPPPTGNLTAMGAGMQDGYGLTGGDASAGGLPEVPAPARNVGSFYLGQRPADQLAASAAAEAAAKAERQVAAEAERQAAAEAEKAERRRRRREQRKLERASGEGDDDGKGRRRHRKRDKNKAAGAAAADA